VMVVESLGVKPVDMAHGSGEITLGGSQAHMLVVFH
jgi:hypothetical protein